MPERAPSQTGESFWKVLKHCDLREAVPCLCDGWSKCCDLFSATRSIFPLRQSLIRGVMNHFWGNKIVNDSSFTLVVYNYTHTKKYFASLAEEEVELCFPFFSPWNRFSGFTLKQNQKRRMSYEWERERERARQYSVCVCERSTGHCLNMVYVCMIECERTWDVCLKLWQAAFCWVVTFTCSSN